MRFFFPLLFAILCAFVGFQFTMRKTFVNPYPLMCDLVAEKIYLPDSDVSKWKKQCLQRSRLVDPSSKPKLILTDMNNMLDLLKVSHLRVFEPALVNQYWKGQSLETGIESEFVDGELVVFKVHPNSTAQKNDIRRGDILVSINEEQPSPWDAQTVSGKYQIRRLEKEFSLDLTTSEIHRDEEIRWVPLKNRQGQLIIPSFRGEFFSEEKMNEIAKSLKTAHSVVVDLRGNAGGNFVAGLRLISLFVCEPTEIGQLIKPRARENNPTILPDNIKDLEQLAIINTHSSVVLKTFANSGCYKGKISVLVDNKSASVAEMTAQALKEVAGAKILGTPSSGELLLGVWYGLDELMKGAEISIPEAVYTSRQGHTIEGQGVQLDRVIYYNLHEMQSGIDSWVRQALDQVPK